MQRSHLPVPFGADELELEIRGFLWRTQDGRIMTIQEMATSHIFNCAKMLYNHLGATYEMEPVLFKHHYSDYYARAVTEPMKLLKQMFMFIYVIDQRQDLPVTYLWPYIEIKANLMNKINGFRANLETIKQLENED